MQDEKIRYFDLGAWLQAETKSRHFVGREIGRRVRDVTEQQLQATFDGAVLTLDCVGVNHLDFTAADEYFAKLTMRVQALDYGDLYVVLAGLTPMQEENVVVALERKNLAMLIQRKHDPEILGDLNPYLRQGYDFLARAKIATARDWAEASGDNISLGSTKFLTLHKKRLVQRVGEARPDGGREFIYRMVEGYVPAREDTTSNMRRVRR